MAESIFPGFKNRMVLVGDQRISVHVGGSGTPLLLLHGYPQNHAAWIKLAGPLAKNFSCVIADLPGYGASSIPADASDHESFSKRRMASLLVSAMASMGYSTFSIMGHDRGARVAYRMALDHPTTIGRVVIIEIIPTSDMWKAFNAEMAMKAYHWSFLAQPFPLPETLIAGDPTFYLKWTLRSWVKGHRLDAFDSRSLESYQEQIRDPARVHAMCEDYRAGASIDRRLDLSDKTRGARITAPLLLTPSAYGKLGPRTSQAQKSIAGTSCQKRIRTLFWQRQCPSYARLFDPRRRTNNGQNNRTLETEVNPRNQHLRREIFSEPNLANGVGNSHGISKANFANRTASSNRVRSAS